MNFQKNYTISQGQQNITNFRQKRRAVFSEGDDYIFDVIKYGQDKLAVSASNFQIKIYDLEGLNPVHCLKHHTDIISSIKCWNEQDNNILLSSSKDGTIALWDLRAKLTPVNKWTDGENGINSFDYNCDGTILAGGTYLNESRHEAKILFWDIRSSNLVQQFVESHNDDVTKLQFHPQQSTSLLSSGMDGLVCTYNLTSSDEDECLDKVINTGTSVQDFGLFGSNLDKVYTLSHMETFCLWNFEGEPIYNFGTMKEASLGGFNSDYVIKCQFDIQSQSLFFISGSYSGNVGIYSVNPGGDLKLMELLEGAHTDVVRSLYWDVSSGRLITGAEDGKLVSWDYQSPSLSNVDLSKFPNKKKESKKMSPY